LTTELQSIINSGKIERIVVQTENPFERSLKRFLLINLGAAEEKRFQLFEPKGRVLKSTGASHRFIKKRFGQSEKGFEQQPEKM
jgi:hypothetical protein